MRKKNAPIKYKRVNAINLHKEYLKVAVWEVLWESKFRDRLKTWYTFNQILEIGKMSSSKFNRVKMPEPRVVQKQKNNKERYWKDYLKNN